MKQVNSFMALCFIAAFLLIVASCSKTGPTGPAGATGATGAAGATGATGPAGPAGSSTSSVIYSDWTTLTFIADTQHNGAVIDTVGAYYNWTAAKLTADILNKGEIKVYINGGTTAAPSVFPIPYNDGNLFIQDNFTLGTISFYANGLIAAPFRYILIPGGTGARSAINWNNYAEVKKYLNLKD